MESGKTSKFEDRLEPLGTVDEELKAYMTDEDEEF